MIINRRILKAALERWGIHMQMDILIEEMSELTKALIKSRRKNIRYANADVLEELADVYLCAQQLLIVCEDAGLDIQPYINKKTERLQTRLYRHLPLIRDSNEGPY